MQKCCLFRGGNDQKSDYRVYAMQQAYQSSLDVLLKVLYPSLMVLHNLPAEVSYVNDMGYHEYGICPDFSLGNHHHYYYTLSYHHHHA